MEGSIRPQRIHTVLRRVVRRMLRTPMPIRTRRRPAQEVVPRPASPQRSTPRRPLILGYKARSPRGEVARPGLADPERGGEATTGVAPATIWEAVRLPRAAGWTSPGSGMAQPPVNWPG